MVNILNAMDFIRNAGVKDIDYGIILGSGLGDFADRLKDSIIIPYGTIPHFPISTIEGHKGNLIYGELHGKRILAMQGRFHYYEGYTMEQIVFPIRVIGRLGAKRIILTNASGGVNSTFKPGDLMLITDHINFMGYNPLMGKNLSELGPRFPDVSNIYSRDLIDGVLNIGQRLGIDLKKGVYMAFTGPSYETPAEIRMAAIVGADCVGMSTAPEALAAAHIGIKVLGISCITNYAAGLTKEPLSHHEVMETANKTKDKFITLIEEILKTL
jgi:purine-nucleoside phosphorylase